MLPRVHTAWSNADVIPLGPFRKRKDASRRQTCIGCFCPLSLRGTLHLPGAWWVLEDAACPLGSSDRFLIVFCVCLQSLLCIMSVWPSGEQLFAWTPMLESLHDTPEKRRAAPDGSPDLSS